MSPGMVLHYGFDEWIILTQVGVDRGFSQDNVITVIKLLAGGEKIAQRFVI